MTDTQDPISQSMPMPGAGERMDHVAITSIARSLTNPRKHFDPAKLQELADSIAASGVHQPILLRPLPGHRLEDTHREARALKQPAPEYELVAGERRWRACQLAKVAQIPAMIRPMTDAQALEAQVIENLQREDVTELEEAEGYESLMQHGALNADQVAAKIGKSRGYVYARLKLLDLYPDSREALREGKIDFSKALTIARIPDEELQRKALKYCTTGNYHGDLPGARAVADHVQQNYMLKLHSAVFKMTDASLLPGAGSCKDCSKRTGANPDLFKDVDSADVCTDPKCYHSKEDAHADAQKKAALERGQTIIEGREAKALMPNSWSSEVKGYLRLDDKNDSPTDKPLRKIIGKAMEAHGIQPTLVANPHKDGQFVAVITSDQAQILLKAADNQEAASRLEAEAQQDIEAAKRKAASDEKHAYEEQWRWNVLTSSWSAVTEIGGAGPTEAVLRHLATNIARGYSQDRAKKLCKLLDLGKVAPVAGLLQYIADTNTPGDVLQLLVMYGDVEYRNWLDQTSANEGLLLVANDYGVDIEAVKAQTKANQRAAKKAAEQAQAAKSAAPKADLPQRPAARAGGDGGRGNAKKGKKPAAHASEAPKTSAAHASAQIAEALQELEGSGAAAAAQGIEGAPVAVAQAPISGAKAQGDKAAPVAAKAAHGLPPASEIEDDFPYPSDDAQQPADAQAAAVDAGQDSTDVKTGTAPLMSFAIDSVVRVKDGLRGPNNRMRKTCGRVGVVQMGAPGCDIPVKFGPRSHEMAMFKPEELEPYKADPIVGKRARVLKAGMTERRNAFMWKEGTVSGVREEGWQITFHSKTGGLPTQEVFGTDELESIE